MSLADAFRHEKFQNRETAVVMYSVMASGKYIATVHFLGNFLMRKLYVVIVSIACSLNSDLLYVSLVLMAIKGFISNLFKAIVPSVL